MKGLRMYAFVFPGQGSQFVGMGHELYTTFPSAREVFHEVDDVLNQKLSKIIFEDSDELAKTENTQPALMAVSLATLAVINHELGYNILTKATAIAGHSLGEYSAVIAAGGMSLADGARILKLRGRSMQDAVPLGLGGMVALLGVNLEQAETIAKLASNSNSSPVVCSVANDNSVGQVVVSGHIQAIEKVMEIACHHGATRAVKLQVSAPFHSSLMEPAAIIMNQALNEIDINPLCVPLVANISAKAIQNAEEVKTCLIEQVTGRVRWRESVETFQTMAIKRVVEIGPGKVLTGLVRRINPDLTGFNLCTPKEITDFIRKL